MSDKKLTRRQFLKGSGGFALSLPFLPSLFTRELMAAVTATGVDKCFFAMATSHGGVHDSDLFGSKLSYVGQPHADLSSYTFLQGGLEGTYSFPTHKFHYGNLVNFLETAGEAGSAFSLSGTGVDNTDHDAGQRRLSYIIGSKFNSLLPKMNLLRGIDLHCGDTGHQSGLFLGHFAAIQDGRPALPGAPTIDHVMINSGDFYKNLDNVKLKQVGLRTGQQISFDKNGAAAETPNNYTSGLFEALFGSQNVDVQSENRSVVDSVLAHYNSFTSPLTSTGKRLGADDKRSLSNFIENLRELERKINVNGSCSPQPQSTALAFNPREYPFKDETNPQIWELLSEIIALAFSCGASRIFTGWVGDENLVRFSSLRSTYHQDVAHSLSGARARSHHRFFHRIAADEVFYKVIATLNSYSGQIPGTTMLDQSLCTWQAESGIQTHNPINNFAVTAGGAGGFFNTGKYIDFRSLESRAFRSDFYDIGGRPGISLNQYLGNILMAMGVPRSKYEDLVKFGGPGYGGWKVNWSFAMQNSQVGFPQVLINRSGDKIPVWTT